jgi:isoleucyl-tRNA synthetase
MSAFDSGTTHWHVLRGSHLATFVNPEEIQSNDTRWADLYLEGSDQHRGWFHSSLLTGAMLDGQPPDKSLLTHGFTVDGQGRKMSKSLGNVIVPQDVANKIGAEIIRLWAASTDYSGEMTISDEISERVVESYRRIRNTLRFLLANLSDFDAKDSVPMDELLEIDQYMLALNASLQEEIISILLRYEFHSVTSRLLSYCSEISRWFLSRYFEGPFIYFCNQFTARRSAQTVLHEITFTPF